MVFKAFRNGEIVMLRHLFILLVVVLGGLLYYKFATSKKNEFKLMAFIMKIFLLVLSFILAFAMKDFISVGGLSFGGRTSVMLIILIEIVDAFIDKKNSR